MSRTFPVQVPGTHLVSIGEIPTTPKTQKDIYQAVFNYYLAVLKTHLLMVHPGLGEVLECANRLARTKKDRGAAQHTLCSPLHGNTRAVSVLERSVQCGAATASHIGASDAAVCKGRGHLHGRVAPRPHALL